MLTRRDWLTIARLALPASLLASPLAALFTRPAAAQRLQSNPPRGLPTALAQPLFGYLLDTFDRTVVALGAAVLTAAGFLCLPFLESRAAIFIDLALVGTASFGIYTAALTLLGQRYSGGMLVAGSAAFALAYSVGSAAGTIAFGAAIQAFSAPAAPITIGIAVLAFAIAFARAGRRT